MRTSRATTSPGAAAEVAWVRAPHLLEVARTADVASLPHALETLVPAAFAPAEAAQATNGGGNQRFGAIFDEPQADANGADRAGRTCVVVTDDARWRQAVADALAARGMECVGVGAGSSGGTGEDAIASGFANVSEQLARVARDAGPIDAVVR